MCLHPHSRGVVGFSIIRFSSMTPPDDGGDGDDDDETKSPPGSRPSPAPAPRDKIGVRDPRTGYFGPWVRVVDWAWTPEETSSRPRRRRRRRRCRRRRRRRRHLGGGVMLENPIIENPINHRKIYLRIFGKKTGFPNILVHNSTSVWPNPLILRETYITRSCAPA